MVQRHLLNYFVLLEVDLVDALALAEGRFTHLLSHLDAELQGFFGFLFLGVQQFTVENLLPGYSFFLLEDEHAFHQILKLFIA